MKHSAPLWFFILILSGCLVFAYFRISQLNHDVVSLQKKIADMNLPVAGAAHEQEADSEDEGEGEEVEIVHYMERLQSFHNKLYFAGINKNTELVNFYLHEIEEEMQAIADAGIVDDGIDISNNMKAFGLKQVDLFQTEIGMTNNDFKQSFQNLTLSCNGCHAASKHEYIKIIVPTTPAMSNQDFKR